MEAAVILMTTVAGQYVLSLYVEKRLMNFQVW